MKGLGPNRSRHLSDSCDPSFGIPEPLYPLVAEPRSPYLLSPAMDHYATMDPQHLLPLSPTSLPPECMLPFNNQISNSSTFPRFNFSSDFAPSSMPGIPTGTLVPSMSMGMSLTGGPMITSGSATISAGSKMNRLPPNLLDQLEKQLPVQRDGFSTLQFQRGRTGKHRSESPGRIRFLMHSVQKLFAKSQSIENSLKGNLNGRSRGHGDDVKQGRRSKSKDRAKTEGNKRRSRANVTGLWGSEDNLDNNSSVGGGVPGGVGGGVCVAGGSNLHPVAMMTLGRPVPDGQGPPKYFPQGYNTISGNTLKVSKINSELKTPVCSVFPASEESGNSGKEKQLVKRGSWSTLTLTQSKQVCPKGSATIDKSLLKSKSCHQELTCRYLQAGEWNSSLGRRRGSSEIPCRRMRSGSYVKAMGDLEDSEDSEGSPKPSPKTSARRQSYLKATQQSLSEQLPPRNCLPSLRELSNNRSLDNLDSISGPPSATFPNWDEEDFTRICNTLEKTGIDKVEEPEISRPFEEPYPGSLFRGIEPPEPEPPDLPLPASFRSRSHSYLRAIQAGCSQDEDTPSLDSDSPPPSATTVHTYSSSTTVSTCITTCKRTPPPVPPRTTSKPFISVTVQSSTESAQDNYLEGQERKCEERVSFGPSNFAEILARASGLVKPTPLEPPIPAPREPPVVPLREFPTITSATQGQKYDTLKTAKPLTAEEAQGEQAPKRKLSSIGIQVDCVLSVEKQETPVLTRFQSIGVQVEDGWQHSRSSSMASKQEGDSEMQEGSSSKPSEKSVGASASRSVDACTTPCPQGNCEGGATRQASNHTGTRSSSSSISESLDPALDPSSLPPPDPWLESGSAPSVAPAGGAPACRRDGHWFLKLLQAETARMEGWCQQMEQETKDNQLSEEVLGRVRSAVGSAQLLMSQKFQQFRGLCEQNLNVNATPRPTAQDLAGFWDLLQLSIEDISMKFDELYQLKSNDWQMSDCPDGKVGTSIAGGQKAAPTSAKETLKEQAGPSRPGQGRQRPGQAAAGGTQEAYGSQAGGIGTAELGHGECGQH